MDESEWLGCADPTLMLEFLRGKASDRKMRLFAVACCRSIWEYIAAATAGCDALQASERYADDDTSQRELAKAGRKAENAGTVKNNSQPRAYSFSRNAGEVGGLLITAIDAAKSSTDKDAFAAAWGTSICAAQVMGKQAAIEGEPATYDDPDTYVREELAGREKQYAYHARLLHDIFGNPFRASPPLPPAVLAWNDRIIPRIAQGIYDERRMPEGMLDTGRLFILHDALLDAGCADEELLTHLRSEGQHVRGCWALDLLLGKE